MFSAENAGEGLARNRLGLREFVLLLVGAGFASQMLNFPLAAIACGAAAVVVWIAAMTATPRPTWKATLALGGGLIVTFVWWPDDDLAPFAIALLWTGIVIAVGAVVSGLRNRRR